MTDNDDDTFAQEALDFHARGRAGKLEIAATKSLSGQRDLSLAYSPGVAAPCLAIEENPEKAYDYTAKGNSVAVVTNGTAVLGLGNIGALASKPVMEGKAVLFKRFADIDGFDIEVNTTDTARFIDTVESIACGFGGINLEDIKAPECFVIEKELKERLDIPVLHDDQHGTAIIAAAGLLNAIDLTGKKIDEITIVVSGAGAAAIACIELMKALGVAEDRVILTDSEGVVYTGREKRMNEWKVRHAVKTQMRSLDEAIRGADMFLGLSVGGILTAPMMATMAPNPIVFAMSNPHPEIMPDLAREINPEVIIATGRSDFPNQINNVLVFPYIFRGALDVRACRISENMKIAAAKSIAALARKPISDNLIEGYNNTDLHYGRDYIIPTPFDPRLVSEVSSAVAAAAMADGVAGKAISDMESYRRHLGEKIAQS